jgi:hypothetical protein
VSECRREEILKGYGNQVKEMRNACKILVGKP